MVVVLCEVADLPALWAARGLERRGVPVEVISAPALSCALEWEHRLSSRAASVSLRLADGRSISDAEPVGVLNRLMTVPTARIDAAAGPDRDYALQEMFALLLSVLSALPGPVVNRPTPQGLGGAWRHPAEWAALAAEAGLAAATYRNSSADLASGATGPRPASGATAFVIGDQVVPSTPAMPTWVLEGCRRLARLAGETLLGVDFSHDGGWSVTGASATPDLHLGGEPLVDALVEVLAA